MKLLFSLALGLFFGFSTLFGANYSVDTAHSSVEFKVRHMMVSNTRGEFEKFSGSYTYDPVKRHLSSLKGVVDVASVNTKEAKRDKHLRTADFFDVTRYPHLKLALVEHKGDRAVFDLTIKATTKRVVFRVEDLSVETKDPWGYFRTGFVLFGKINRKDFGITFSKLLETGGVVVGDTVKITIEIEGIKG